MTLILTLFLTGSNGWTQTCDRDRRCFSRAEVRALVDAKCAADRLKAEASDDLVGELDVAEEQLGICKGRLLELRSNPPEAPKIAPLWLRVVLDVGIGAFSAATGAIGAIGAPGEAIAVGATLAVSALVARLVLEVVTWR